MILDLVLNASREDTCLVLPTLKHLLWYRERIVACVADYKRNTHQTRTGIVFRDSHTILRLWVPYAREPSLPLDTPKNRRGFVFVSLYYTRRELADYGRS